MASLMSPRRAVALAVLVLIGLLYYRPLHDFFSSRAQRADRVAQVAKLEHQRAALERKLRDGSSLAALIAEARVLGYIRPGDHLFLVKNIPQWRRQNGLRRDHSR